MTARARIGVIGAYGAVGRAAVTHLRGAFAGRLRVGGRDPDLAERLVREDLDGHGEAMAVDVYDASALATFCDDCDVVVHAGGPSYLVVDRVALAALAAGADYVDAGGDYPLYDRLSHVDFAATGRRALITAGMMPGLSGVLPRWLATTGFSEVRALTAYVGVMDRLTPAGAVDYLLSLGGRDLESQAAWVGGRRITRTMAPRTDVVVPFFPGRVAVYPYLGYEAERLAGQLGLDEVRWFSVFDGGANMMATLSRLQGAMSGEGDVYSAAAELAGAADLDLFGREPYQLMVFEMSGRAPDGADLTRTLVVRSRDTSTLTGTVCALAALAVLDRAVPKGVHFAAEGLDPAALVAAVRGSQACSAFELLKGGAEEAAAVEEGVL